MAIRFTQYLDEQPRQAVGNLHATVHQAKTWCEANDLPAQPMMAAALFGWSNDAWQIAAKDTDWDPRAIAGDMMKRPTFTSMHNLVENVAAAVTAHDAAEWPAMFEELEKKLVERFESVLYVPVP